MHIFQTGWVKNPTKTQTRAGKLDCTLIMFVVLTEMPKYFYVILTNNNMRMFYTEAGSNTAGQSRCNSYKVNNRQATKERKSPDAFIQQLSSVSCWAWRHFINFVKVCLWQIRNYLGLIINSVYIYIWSSSFVWRSRAYLMQLWLQSPNW